MEVDWDLHAVVRGCSAASSTSSSASTTSSLFNLPLFEKTISLDPIGPTLLPSSSSIEELHDLCKPFFSKSPKPLPPHIPPPPPPPTSSSPSLVSPLSPSSPFSYNSGSTSTPTTSTTKTLKNNNNLQPKNLKLSHPSPSSSTPRSKRRKNQLKKVCQVPAESLSSDIWAWRKYGQKPIKGSPYPRGYYRCSSSKGCLARKQVERNRSDPSMFIVTYTAEHNHPAPTHRNSLAGSTRQKPATAAGAGETEKTPAKQNSPANSEEEEIVPPSQVEMEDLMEEEEDEELGLSDSVLTDDFFDGLDELTGPPAPPSAAAPVTGDVFGDPFSSAGFGIPAWPTTNAAATAGGNC